jgi:hypothetical protein
MRIWCIKIGFVLVLYLHCIRPFPCLSEIDINYGIDNKMKRNPRLTRLKFQKRCKETWNTRIAMLPIWSFFLIFINILFFLCLTAWTKIMIAWHIVVILFSNQDVTEKDRRFCSSGSDLMLKRREVQLCVVKDAGEKDRLSHILRWR